MTLTWAQAAAWRMERHGLTERKAASDDAVLEVCGRLCGLHAQVMSSAELTAWARLDGLERGEVARLLWEDRRLVKTWAVRGTLHLLPARELPLWHAAFSTFAHFTKPAWLKAFGFGSPGEVEALVAAVAEALDGRELSREELAAAVGEHGDARFAEALRESWGSALKPAAFRGQLQFARSTGQNVRFTRPVQGDRPAVEDALAETTRRFLAAYGPARREDLSRWWGTGALSPAQAQKRIEALGDEVVQLDVDGARCWMLAADAAEAAATAPAQVARLVPLFDQLVVNATRGIDALLPQAEKARVYRQAGWISPVVLLDGVMAGTWTHERRGERLSVAIEPFGRLPPWARPQLEAEAERLAAFTGGRLGLTLG